MTRNPAKEAPDMLMYRGHTISFHKDLGSWRYEIRTRGRWVGGGTVAGYPTMVAIAHVDRLAARPGARRSIW